MTVAFPPVHDGQADNRVIILALELEESLLGFFGVSSGLTIGAANQLIPKTQLRKAIPQPGASRPIRTLIWFGGLVKSSGSKRRPTRL